MGDIRLKTVDYQYGGHTYRLACNMNVLADVQEAYEGNLMKALNTARSLRAILVFLAAMLNDAADTEGRPERFTAKQLGRELSIKETQDAGLQIFPIILAAVGGDEEKTEEEKN